MGDLRPPHPPKRIPLLGDVIGMDPARPMQKTVRMHDELGPIYERRVLGFRITFVGCADLATEVNDDKVRQKAIARPLQRLRPIVADGLFTRLQRRAELAQGARHTRAGVRGSG